MKLTLLLIPLIFLSSCTIDGSDDDFSKKQTCIEFQSARISKEDIYQQFYSKEIDSCVIYTIKEGVHILYDAFTNEVIATVISSSEKNDELDSFMKKYHKLKGE